jgi:hypothetical protein
MVFDNSILQWSDRDFMAMPSSGADHDTDFEVDQPDDHEGDHDTQSVPSNLPTESTEQYAHQDDDHNQVTHDSEYVSFDTAGERPAVENDRDQLEISTVTDPIRGEFANREDDLEEEDEDCYHKILSIRISINLEDLSRVMVRRISSIFASAIVRSCSNRAFMSCLTCV